MNEMRELRGPQDVPAELKEPVTNLLLSLGDDEFILGYWDSEWTGVAPILEEDVAMSSIAQDEIGHARLFYQQVVALTGAQIDTLAYGRQPHEYRQVQLVERNRGDWAFTIARQFLYDTADQMRLDVMKASTYVPLAQDVGKIEREEVYHQMHVHVWLERLASGTLEAQRRLEAALERLWPDALGMFEAFPGEEQLVAAGILKTSSAQLQHEWLAVVTPILERLHLPTYHMTMTPRLGGRYGQHTQDFQALWEQMTMVYRLDPQASW